MKRSVLLLACCLVFMPAWGDKASAEVEVVKLAITPAAAPTPLMRYQLSPRLRQLHHGNAAVMYYRACVLWEQHQNSKEDNGKVSDLLEEPLDKFPVKQARELLDRYHATIHEVELGTRRDRCEWDLPLDQDGIETVLPEVQSLRALARLLALQARAALAEKNFEAASRSLESMLSMAQHIGASDTLVSALVGLAIANTAAKEIDLWSEQPDAPNLYWALTALPQTLIDMRRAMASEQLFLATIPYVELLEESVLSAEQARELAAKMNEMYRVNIVGASDRAPTLLTATDVGLLPHVMMSYPSAKRQLIEQGIPSDGVESMPVFQVVMLRWLQEYRNFLDRMTATSHRPHAEVVVNREAIDKDVARVETLPEGAMVRWLLPAVSAATDASARTAQRFEMLRVVEALRMYAAEHNGRLPSRLEEIQQVAIPIDPATGRPFLYQRDGDTARLRGSQPGLFHGEVEYELTIKK